MLRRIFVTTLAISLLSLSACQTTKGPRYQNVRSFSEGLAPVQASNGRWGYIDKDNHWVIPAKFEDAQAFSGERAAVKLHNKWGFINKHGEWQ